MIYRFLLKFKGLIVEDIYCSELNLEIARGTVPTQETQTLTTHMHTHPTTEANGAT